VSTSLNGSLNALIADAAPGVDAVLARARRRLDRLTPQEAADAVADGALLVDTRPRDQRLWEGGIPGALIIERNVLEWRLDPASESRIPEATSYDVQVILFCSEGYATSLAAASLQDVGLWRATDLIGGFHAWARSGLPTTSARSEHSVAAGP
jgi:rhodanese-related sulfurtransferase